MHLVDEVFAGLVACRDACATRRQLLLAPLPRAVLATAAQASKINPSETAITLPNEISWVAWSGLPPHSGEMATLYGGLDKPGPYLNRLSLVLSGTWWVNSGADFDPDATLPVPAGGFIRRVARTPHYDSVKKSAEVPAVIALFGIAPVELQLVDPIKPAWRQL